MNTTTAPRPGWTTETTVLLTIGLVWLQLFVALVPVWRFGLYYDYGWLVPPIALSFALRRRSMGLFGDSLSQRAPHRFPIWWLVALVIFVGGFLAGLRIVEMANLDWRPPLIFHALIAAAGSHVLVWYLCGWKASVALMPVTLFALSAVPYPGRAEEWLISRLTQNVLAATTEYFHLTGLPVEQMGDKLSLHGEMVEVTEGCSGIRSLQSLIMAGLFFGELLLLSWGGRVVILAVASGCALVLNVARAYWLAKVHFLQGKESAAAIHDTVGHLAFGVSALILLTTAWLLSRQWGARTVVTIRKNSVISK